MSHSKRDMPSFETLVELAARDPDGLEHLRADLIRDFIEQAPHGQRQRLKGLQFTIDMERRKARNPVQSCVRMSQMMHDRITDLYRSLNGFSGPAPPAASPATAKIIPLRPAPREDAPDES